MSKDLTDDELDRELARMAGRPALVSRAPLALNEADGDITGDELDVALAHLTGRSVSERLAEDAERDGAAREARTQANAPTSARPRTLADAAYEARRAPVRRGATSRTVAEGRRVVPITETGPSRVIGGTR
ncbi:hypothetical protein [Cellulosimicrobium sp. KWT-B]|uniref:hypothetical protein n=1 Tax=Cellulosimicrobium sp. KWT-B TaxID=1981152 RepID=UPI000A3213A2|nr:hypothetical protein [Cellulosimicrobium sp. KWT-B]